MAAKKRKKAEPAPGWAWMLFGLSIGLAVALVVYLTSGQAVLPDIVQQSVARMLPAERTERTERTDLAGRAEPAGSAELADAEQSAPEPQTPAEAVSAEVDTSDDSELSFYVDLAESTVEVNEGEFEFASEFDTPQNVIIQAGSFPSTGGADGRRANLAFLGFESRIEQAIVDGRTYHRVIIGPFSDPGEINRTLRRLSRERIDTVLRVVSN